MSENPIDLKNEIAQHLIVPLFRSIDSEYKQKYLKDIWDQFENRVRDSAYTSSLAKFLEAIASRLPIHIDSRYLDDLSFVLNSGKDEEVLTLLRDETIHLILIARIINKEANSHA